MLLSKPDRSIACVLFAGAAFAFALHASAAPGPATTKGTPCRPLESAADPADPVVARVGTAEIRRSELDGIWDRVDGDARKLYESAGGKSAFLREVASKKRLVLDAEKKGIDNLPDVRLDFWVARDSILYDRYIEKQILPSLMSEAELRAEYEKRKETYRHPAKWHARHILVTGKKEEKIKNRNGDDAKTDEEATKKIEFLAGRVRAGVDFETLARDYSEDPTTERGGDLGWFAKAAMVPEFQESIEKMKPGEVSGVVKTVYGWHILQLIEREEEGYTPYEKVADALRAQLTSDRGAEIQKKIEERTRSLEVDFPLVVIDPALKAR